MDTLHRQRGQVEFKYAISYISVEEAKSILKKELAD